MRRDVQASLKTLPSVGEILEREDIKKILEDAPRGIVIALIRNVIDDVRSAIMSEQESTTARSKDDLAALVEERFLSKYQNNNGGYLKRVINATGVVIHTNLGRAPLAPEAIAAVKAVSEGYSNLEYDLSRHERGSRHEAVSALLVKLTGAESALIVNNNAAAVFLVLNTISQDREVIVSRGEQVEIGGSFRIPDVIKQSGAVMVEVGTTNKTRLSDYASAVTELSAVLLKIHRSNFSLIGFVEDTEAAELVGLAKKRNLAVVEDLGSGCLVNLPVIGLAGEPTVSDSIRAGVDIVTFSGDKLLGGPQAGIIVGRSSLIDMIAKNPLTRALRPDKMTLAALEATLALYIDPKDAVKRIPVLNMLVQTSGVLKEKAEKLADKIGEKISEVSSTHEHPIDGSISVTVVEDTEQIGGGASPGVDMPGYAVRLMIPGIEAGELQARLCNTGVPVITRVNNDAVMINVRTVTGDEEDVLLRSLCEAVGIKDE